MSYIKPVEVRLATREELEALGLSEEAIEKVLSNQPGEPGEVLDTYTPGPIKPKQYKDFNLQD